jgi:antitoxin VapB
MMIELSQETEALARRLAAAQGISIEEAIKEALEQKAREAGLAAGPGGQRDGSARAVAARKAGLDEIANDIARMPVLDARTPRDIMDDLNAR